MKSMVARSPRYMLLLLAAAFSTLCANGRAYAAESLTLMTDWAPWGIQAPLFLAAQKGWFKKAGVDVTIKDGTGSVTTIQLVAAKAVDVGFAQLAAMAVGIGSGMPITSVSCYIRAGDNGIIYPNSSGFTTPKSLIGKRIGYALGSTSASLMDAYFRQAGIKNSQITLVGLNSSVLASAYVSGKIDAAVSAFAYFQPIIDKEKPSDAFSYAASGLVVPSFGLIVRNSEIKSDSKALARMVRVVGNAWQYILDGHQKEAIDDLLLQRPKNRLDKQLMLAQLDGYLKLMDTPATKGKPIGWQATSDWKSALSALKTSGLVKNVKNPSDYFTNQFINKN